MSLRANTSPATGTLAEPTGIFQLSRELRDLIYDQPGMLEDKILHKTTEGVDVDLIVSTKPRANLRLACRQLDAEYMERCEGRKRVLVRTTFYAYSSRI